MPTGTGLFSLVTYTSRDLALARGTGTFGLYVQKRESVSIGFRRFITSHEKNLENPVFRGDVRHVEILRGRCEKPYCAQVVCKKDWCPKFGEFAGSPTNFELTKFIALGHITKKVPKNLRRFYLSNKTFDNQDKDSEAVIYNNRVEVNIFTDGKRHQGATNFLQQPEIEETITFIETGEKLYNPILEEDPSHYPDEKELGVIKNKKEINPEDEQSK